MTSPTLVFLLAAAIDPLVRVDPMIGTGRDGYATPGAVAPFGMIQWSPVTPSSPISSYDFADDEMLGMSLTHMSGTGCPNASEFPITPTVGRGNASARIGFSHADEAAAPGYYRLGLANGVGVELTATLRTGMARYEFPRVTDANILIDAGTAARGAVDGELKVAADGDISGWTRNGGFCGSNTRYTVYFAARADRPFRPDRVSDAKLLLAFDTRDNPTVQLKVAISYVSEDNARRNLDAENPGWSFDATRTATADAWRERLSAIEVAGGTEARTKVFYTALYHALMHPNVFSDVNGDYIGFDGVVRNDDRPHYANFSGWDVYRSQMQLIAWLFPDVGSDIARSLVADADQCGALPKWSQNNVETTVMVGDPGAAAVASLHAFGARDFDARRALQYMRKTGLEPGAHCNGLQIRLENAAYLRDGYVPLADNGVWGAVSTTMEYAIADFAVAAFAKSLADAPTQATFARGARSWQNLFHGASRLIRPRDAAGNWVDGITETSTTGYVEGTAAQYRWMVPHDPRELIGRLGGDAAAVTMLDHFFQELNAGAESEFSYVGNEPGFWAPWLYLWARAPSRTQDVVRRVALELFRDEPNGLPGNDDMGATSSWLVWAAMGLFPMAPGVSGLAVASPEFAEITVHLGPRKALVIEAPGAPDRYVSALSLDGRASESPWLGPDAVERGGHLRFTLSATPSNWGSKPDAVPGDFLSVNDTLP